MTQTPSLALPSVGKSSMDPMRGALGVQVPHGLGKRSRKGGQHQGHPVLDGSRWGHGGGSRAAWGETSECLSSGQAVPELPCLGRWRGLRSPPQGAAGGVCGTCCPPQLRVPPACPGSGFLLCCDGHGAAPRAAGARARKFILGCFQWGLARTFPIWGLSNGKKKKKNKRRKK